MKKNTNTHFYICICLSVVCFALCAVPSAEATRRDLRTRVTGFYLISRANGRVLRTLTNGSTVSAASLPSSGVEVRIGTTPTHVGKVSLVVTHETANSAGKAIPRVIRRIREQAFSNKLSWSPIVGVCHLSATPYLRRAVNSRPGVSSSITFTVVASGKVANTTSASSNSNSSPAVTGSSALTAVWANDGGDKVTRDELRATDHGIPGVSNSLWNGSVISLFGAKNEVVAFNLILEAGSKQVNNVSVQFDQLNGPNGAVIQSKPASGDALFNFVGRNIELFYVRYLQIKGLSGGFYGHYDERQIPIRFRRPWTGNGSGTGTWQDRPDHDKFYPDIAVPMEAVNEFNIAQGQNQSVWSDIYIPKNAVAGTYTGTVTITENGAATRQIPVSLTVRKFALPDSPSAKTMIYIGASDINMRYLGTAWPNTTAGDNTASLLRDRYFEVAHRHKLSLIDDDTGNIVWNQDAPRPDWTPRLDGSLFTSANGYDGPGVGVGNNIYSVGTYSEWTWKGQGEAAMQTHADAWVNWFDKNSAATEYFLYLIDESTDYAQTNQWASWIKSDAGPGARLKSFATADFTKTLTAAPALDIPCSWMTYGITSVWQSARDAYYAAGKQAWLYNSNRPASGSMAIEDDGVALRELAWGQYKKGIKRWFFWDGDYYNNTQGGTGQTNLFTTAQTFGSTPKSDPILGQTGNGYQNGDGVLMYPGTDTSYPNESYGLKGPIASLRIKHWRRGIQDVDYLTLANAINPTKTQAIVSRMIPKALWEYGVTNPTDPSYVLTDISWSTKPDDWETARAQLASIIDGQ